MTITRFFFLAVKGHKLSSGLIVGLASIILGLSVTYAREPLNAEEDFGKSIFLTRNYGNAATSSFPPEDVLLALQIASSEVPTNDPLIINLRSIFKHKGLTFAPYFENFGFIKDPGNREPFGLPIGLGRSVVDKSIDATCALCHSGRLPTGKFKLGMPNTELNLGQFLLALDAVLGLGLSPQQQAALATFGPGRLDDVAGKDDDGFNIPTNIPAHWGALDNWKFFEWGGETRHYAERNAFTYFLIGVDPSFGKLPPQEEMTALVAFLKTIEPPINPRVNKEAAKRGETVFQEAGCLGCHNGPDHMNNDFLVPLSDRDRMPGEDPAFPNGSIATDALRNCIGRETCGGNTLQKLLDSGVELVATNGYKVAPLSGAWATAPYLHNGSVPTLRDLLEPATRRPARFNIHGFSFDTRDDISFMGLGGNSNRGHEFGVGLSDQDKEDLVEFLKSL